MGRIALGTALIAGLTACGEMQTEELAQRTQSKIEEKASLPGFECYFISGNGQIVSRETPESVCIGKYEIEKSALPYLARLQGMHPEMASVQILEQVNNFTDEDFVIKAMEIAPYANSKNVSRVITYCRYSRDSCNK